jgi:hypothetical protein
MWTSTELNVVSILCRYFPGLNLSDDIREIALEVNIHKTKCMLQSPRQNADQYRDIETANRSFENVSQSEYLWTTVTNQNLIHD